MLWVELCVGWFVSAAAKSLQSCPTLCYPIDGSPPGSPVPGILQARTLEWVAIFFSNAWEWKVKVKSLSRVRLFTTPWTAAYQAPPSMGFSRQEYWSGVPLPSLWFVSISLQKWLPWWFRWQRICLRCRRLRFNPWVMKIPWWREWLPTAIFFPGEFHEQRRLAGYSPWGRKESDMNEQLTLSLSPPKRCWP